MTAELDAVSLRGGTEARDGGQDCRGHRVRPRAGAVRRRDREGRAGRVHSRLLAPGRAGAGGVHTLLRERGVSGARTTDDVTRSQGAPTRRETFPECDSPTEGSAWGSRTCLRDAAMMRG